VERSIHAVVVGLDELIRQAILDACKNDGIEVDADGHPSFDGRERIVWCVRERLVRAEVLVQMRSKEAVGAGIAVHGGMPDTPVAIRSGTGNACCYDDITSDAHYVVRYHHAIRVGRTKDAGSLREVNTYIDRMNRRRDVSMQALKMQRVQHQPFGADMADMSDIASRLLGELATHEGIAYFDVPAETPAAV
jgi:hypothetical protein